MSASDQFILHSSSFSSDDSDVEYMLLNDDIEHTMVIVIVRNLQDRLRMEMQRGSIVHHLCIPRNRALPILW
jgi:hypothetical protein